MAEKPSRNLALILTRELASNLATPLFIIDPDGNLVFYNEAAEAVLGRRFAESGSLTMDEWAGPTWDPHNLDGTALKQEDNPLVIALQRQKPAHRALTIMGLDGVQRGLEVTAFPIFARASVFVGAVAIFWENS